MSGYGLLSGAMLWGFLVGLFHTMGGLPGRTSDVVLGAACVGLPWLGVHVARAWAEARLIAAARWYPPPRRREVARATLAVWLPPALGLAGLMAGAAAGLLEVPGRALGSVLATLPLALLPLVLGMALGELAVRQGRGGRELEAAELLVATLGVVAITAGLRGRAEALRAVGSALRRIGPAAWVGPASTGQLPLEAWALVLALAALVAIQLRLWGSAPLPEPTPRPGRLPGPVPIMGGRPGGVWRHLIRSHLRRWGMAGPLALLVAAGCLAVLAPTLLELGRIPGDGPLDLVEFTFLVQLALGLALVIGVPDWTPPPARDLDVPGVGRPPQEADRAYGVGLWRALAPGVLVVGGLAAGGALDLRGTALSLAEGWVLATACVGLAVVAIRLPGRPGTGALLYLAGVGLLVLPHLVLDLSLTWLQEPGEVRIAGLLWSWITVKALAVVISTGFGAVIPLVYCKAWSQPPPFPKTSTSASPPPASDAWPDATP